jgi:hypothetical protein
MSRFDVYQNPEGPGYLLDVQASILNELNTRVIIPLMEKQQAPEPSRIPSFYTIAKVSVTTRDCCRISVYRWMSGLSLCSGMLGIRS